jgi:hypothetical protein
VCLTIVDRFRHLVEDAPESILVGSSIQAGLSSDLLRAHVSRSPKGNAGLGKLFFLCAGRRLGDAEVHEDRMPGFQEDVGRLYVPVDDPLFVGVGQGISHFSGMFDGVFHRKLLLTFQDRRSDSPFTKGMT